MRRVYSMLLLVAVLAALCFPSMAFAEEVPETVQDSVPFRSDGFATELASDKTDILGMGLSMRWRLFQWTDNNPQYPLVDWDAPGGSVDSTGWAGVVFVDDVGTYTGTVPDKYLWPQANGSSARRLVPSSPLSNATYLLPNSTTPVSYFKDFSAGAGPVLGQVLRYRAVVYWSGIKVGSTYSGEYRLVEYVDGLYEFARSSTGTWSQSSAPTMGVVWSDSGLITRAWEADLDNVTTPTGYGIAGSSVVGGGYTLDPAGIAAVDASIDATTYPTWIVDGLEVNPDPETDAPLPPGFELPDWLDGFQEWAQGQLGKMTDGMAGLLWWLDIFDPEAVVE